MADDDDTGKQYTITAEDGFGKKLIIHGMDFLLQL